MNLICGINPVLEALHAGTRLFDRLLIAKGVRNRRVSEAIALASRLGVPLRFEGRPTLDRMANGLNHQGLIAVVSSKAATDLEALLGSAHDPGLLVVLDGVEDPRNLGAIIRTVEAAGADGVIQPERHSAPLSETVSRASAGALEYVNVARIGNLAQALETLKARGFWVVGFDAAGTDRWHAPDYKRSVALVFGGEGRGMRRLVRERCDQVVALPLFGHVSSLNVSVTVGAALYEVIRQRGYIPSHVRPIPAKTVVRQRQIIGPSPEDLEEDPGRIGPPLEAGASSEEGLDADGNEGSPHTISVIDLHEEVGWARTVVASVEGSPLHGSPTSGPRRGDEWSERPARGRGVPSAGPESARRLGDGRRGRRRRRHGRPAAPPTHAQPGGEPRPAPQAAPAPPESQPSQPNAGPPGHPAGRRNRRRRRHRRR
jgi:23S rRNA (guanosine2251-2'-O)-methyltransferase